MAWFLLFGEPERLVLTVAFFALVGTIWAGLCAWLGWSSAK